MEQNKLTLVRRDNGEKEEISRDNLKNGIDSTFEDIFAHLKERAKSLLEEKIQKVDTIEKAREMMDNRDGIIKVYWCGKEECGLALEDEPGGDVPGREINRKEDTGECLICGEKNSEQVLVSKTY